mmetsp:Transcript_12225/g.22225  ORF Transcript_12225/g.22225 Transcript_12225/m.22225 type:complete len:125 (-) Transcript_12225:246-620(-)|eukprot:CAMPEP_0202480324 /NCGR_PEP_ID=MMETSP1361-20130828/361_1 /ASSEMBLY_ACC=CAM_ASM_000849 /TAXON_ID=210615 /ORGANISM="Staurosira complex sp., Strain CCMP2646" /LENGTH=124 /DNA_ID=CAMNT_0049107749 /DNA_START=33 /DNA_END=407 /DNA_ORIENTATION=+
MQSGTGIQELMAAETRASQIVAEARIARGDRMKQAKADAQELINAYRAEKQEEFNNMVLSKGGSEGSASAKLQGETQAEIKAMQDQFQKNAQKAVDVLLSKCCEVSLEVPTARIRATQKAAGVA